MGLIRFIIFLALGYVIYRIVKTVVSSPKQVGSKRKDGVIDEMVQDPFCQTYVPRRDARRKVIQGKEYFFCSEECRDKYLRQSNTQ
jgi:uncharacterized protein